MYSERASCNLLCQHDVAKTCDIFEVPDWGIRVMSDDGPLDIVLCGKRYVIDVRNTRQISDGEFKKMWVLQIKKWCKDAQCLFVD